MQAGIGARPGGATWTGNWTDCSAAVGAAYSRADVAAPMMPVYARLLRRGGLRMLVYSGDDDSVCATLGTQQWIWDMGLQMKSAWRPWTMPTGPDCPDGPACRQVAGFATLWQGLSLVTVHGAGHMVPSTRPALARLLLRMFLAGEV